MDRTIVILVIILLIIFGIVLITLGGSNGTGESVARSSGLYASQSYGAGCGR